MRQQIRRVADYLLKPSRMTIRRFWYSGRNRYCPICDQYLRSFLPYGMSARPDVACPLCGSAERHRFAWLVLKQYTSLFDRRPHRLIHFAPEGCLREKLRIIKYLAYKTADLIDPTVDYKVDLAQLPWNDESFDSVICLNVLQHVSDVSVALRELYRIIRPGGWALFSVPINGSTTTEHGAAGYEQSQPSHGYGFDNSKRSFGSDFGETLRRAGFSVRIWQGSDVAAPALRSQSRISENELLFHCGKPM